jgi:hypothetical protein
LRRCCIVDPARNGGFDQSPVGRLRGRNWIGLLESELEKRERVLGDEDGGSLLF